MAKKSEAKELKKQEAKPEAAAATAVAVPAVQAAAKVPAVADDLASQFIKDGASTSLANRISEMDLNLSLIENVKIGRIKPATTGLLMDAANPDDEPVQEVKGVIVFGAKYKAFYMEKYDPDSAEKKPPDCFSHDGKAPSPDSENKQAAACKGCANNEFESADVGKGKACRDMRRLFLLLSVKEGEEAIMPIQLNVTPTSLKAWDEYMGKLLMFGISVDKVQTIIKAKQKSRDDKYCVLSFSKGEDYSKDPVVMGNIRCLKKYWLPHMQRSHVEQDEVAEPTAAPAQASAATPGEF